MSVKRKASSTILTERPPPPSPSPVLSRSPRVQIPIKKRKNSYRPIQSLNEELLLHIFSHLNLQSVCDALLVCHKWYRIGSDNKIWRDLYYANFFKKHRFQTTLSIGNERKPGVDWKSLFKLRYNWNRGVCDVKTIRFPACAPLPVNQDSSISLANTAAASSPLSDLTPVKPKILVASRNRIIVTFNSRYEMEVWNCDETLLARGSVQDWLKEDLRATDLGNATVLIVNPVGALKFCVGFDTGSFVVVSLEGLNHNDPKLVPKQIAILDHSRYGSIVHIVQRQTLLAVYTARSNIILYSFADGITKTLSVMKSYIDPNHEVAFTIRSVHYQRYLFCISLAYFQLTISGEWIPCVQEILCNPEGRIINTRMSTYCSNNTTSTAPSPKWSHGFTSYPVAISYNHPYLLAGYSDNTLSLYIARSAECCLEVQPRQRLWGHTSGIKHVFVKQGGTAVSVSTGAKEIRWWDLDIGSVASNLIHLPKNIFDSSNDEYDDDDDNKHTNNDTMDNTKSITTGKFFTFDDEMILVETLRNDEHFLMICDFR